MRERGGSVINMVSVGGLTYGGPIGVYDVGKAALIHLTRHLATELGPRVRVNGIAPGLVKTDMARALWENFGDALAKRLAMRRLGEPADIAGDLEEVDYFTVAVDHADPVLDGRADVVAALRVEAETVAAPASDALDHPLS